MHRASSSSSWARASSVMLHHCVPRQWPRTPLQVSRVFPPQNNQSSCWCWCCSCDIENNVQPVANVWLTFFLTFSFSLSLFPSASFLFKLLHLLLLPYTWPLINISLFIRYKSPCGYKVISVAQETPVPWKCFHSRTLFSDSLLLLHIKSCQTGWQQNCGICVTSHWTMK